MNTCTYSVDTWDEIANTIDLGWPVVKFSNGTECRIAPGVAELIRERVSLLNSGIGMVQMEFDWEEYAVICHALTAMRSFESEQIRMHEVTS